VGKIKSAEEQKSKVQKEGKRGSVKAEKFDRAIVPQRLSLRNYRLWNYGTPAQGICHVAG